MSREETLIPNIEYTTATGRYDESRSPIELIVLHSTAGTLQAAISLFGSNPQVGKETSTHYIIENDGKLYQGLEEYFTAYHCGNLDKNRKSIGIEHVDEGANVKLHTDAQYEMSIKLVADICRFYNIPADSSHIIPHSSVVPTACPNGLDIDRIIKGVQALLNQQPPQLDCQKELSDLKIIEKSLRDAIGKKDVQIKTLYLGLPDVDKTILDPNKQIEVISASLLNLTTQLSSTKDELLLVSQQLKDCQLMPNSTVELSKRLNELQKRYDKLKSTPSKAIISILFEILDQLKKQP